MARKTPTVPYRKGGMTDAIVSFVVGTKAPSIPAGARRTAKLKILDTLGVSLAAAGRPIGAMVTGYVAAAGGTAEASVLGSRRKVPAPMAALANGTLANAIDFDEGTHLSTAVLPTALAIAEREGLSGKALLDGYIVGFEVGFRLTKAVDALRPVGRGPTRRGFWHVGLIGPLAAAATAARMLKLGRAETATALGIASCSAGGFRNSLGTMAKALHSGNAARAGIEAALLARQGFTAESDILEAPLGYMAALTAPDERDVPQVTEMLGKPFVLDGPPRIKPFPACTPVQPGLDALLALRGRENFKVGDIESIETDLHTFSLLRPTATDESSAGFCSPYLLAATLVHGALGLDQTGDEAVRDRRVQALAARVKGTGDKDVTLRLKDGRVLVAKVKPVRRLTTVEEVTAKFCDCAGRTLSARAVAGLVDLVLGLEREAGVARLMRLAGRPTPR